MKRVIYFSLLCAFGSIIDKWSCSNCGAENPDWRRRCAVCLTSKKAEGKGF